MVKHDENRDVRSLSRICKINPFERSIQASKTAIIGIHAWGKIDYLCHYCGYHFYWNNSAGVGSTIPVPGEKIDKKAAKKAAKENAKRNAKKKKL